MKIFAVLRESENGIIAAFSDRADADACAKKADELFGGECISVLPIPFDSPVTMTNYFSRSGENCDCTYKPKAS